MRLLFPWNGLIRCLSPQQNRNYPDPSNSPLDKKTMLNESQYKEMKQAFILLDKDHDGCINASEVKEMMEMLGFQTNDDHVRHVLKRAGKEGDGLISEEEFYVLMNQFTSSNNEEEVMQDLMAAFRVFDKDGNGFISKEELKQAMEMIGEPLTDQALNDLLRAADVDHDGNINYEEFARMLL